MLASQLLSGGMSPREVNRWSRWYWSHRRQILDPSDESNRRIRYTASTLWSFIRRPRYFAGTFIRRPQG
jgi:hypothetical protein